jgi:hypothetical protein
VASLLAIAAITKTAIKGMISTVGYSVNSLAVQG